MANILRRCLITGCSRGIGLGLVEVYLARGDYHVVATCRTPQSATKLIALKEAHGDRLTILPLDVTCQQSFVELTDALTTNGISSVDILIGNAGISGIRDTVLDSTEENMIDTFRTNVVGSMLTAQALSPLVLASSLKIFVMVSSVMGSVEIATAPGAAAYKVSKAALNMLCKTLSSETSVQDAGGKVIVLHPGWVDTDMGSTGGRVPPVSVSQSTAGIFEVIDKVAQLQLSKKTTESEDEMMHALLRSNCAFVDYNGHMIPW